MKPLDLEARQLAERFAGTKLDKLEPLPAIAQPAAELREASLNWIEHHTEKRLATRRLLVIT
jgi:hypothetical protein